MDIFQGFEGPEENWTKMPNDLVESMPLVETISELKVILYIVRHTWGYHDTEKRITLDEFQNGRKRRDGTRLDAGTGLSRNAIKDGIERAIEHGFIVREDDGRDAARSSHVYSLALLDDDRGSKFDPQVSEFDPQVSEFDPRSEKETIDKKPKKQHAAEADSATDAGGEGSEDYLDTMLGFAKKKDGTYTRPKGWRAADEGAYKLCQRVAELWTRGKLASFGRDIDNDLSAAHYIIDELHDGDVRAAIHTIDEYHRDGGSELKATGAFSLRNVLRTYMSDRTPDGKTTMKVGK